MKRFAAIIFTLIISSSAFAQKEAAKLNKSGVDLGNSGRYSEAVSRFNMSIELYDMETSKTIHNIGWLLELKNDPANALLFYEEALRRNGNQLHTLERAGYILYTLKNYEKAIVYGEKVMKLEPLNQEVIKWLPDAYAQMFKAKQQNITQKVQEKEQQKIIEKVQEQKEEEKKYRRLITVTYEAMARSTYLRAGDDGYKYKKTNAYGYDIPHMFTLDLTPFDSWEIRASTGVPYYGAVLDQPVWWTEKVEGLFFKKDFFLGMGFMGNHYNGTEAFGEKVKLSDYKLGIIMGKFENQSRLEVSFYPRMFPADTGTTQGKTFDVDSLDVSYWYMLQEGYKLYGKISVNDFYYFDNATYTSDYYGVYGLTLGIAFNDKYSSSYVVKFDVTEKMYLENLDNTRPYAFMNGQGLCGLDAYHWFKGDPMSGVNTFATALSLYVEERVVPRFFLYQKIIAEFVGKNQRGNDFCFVFGVGGYY